MGEIGKSIPADTELLFGETDEHNPFVPVEQMMPFIPFVRVRDIDEAIAKAKYYEHIQSLEKQISPAGLPVAFPVFADALKNKRSFVSMQESLDTMLANAKIAADGYARAIMANLDCLNTDGSEFEFLFADHRFQSAIALEL